MTEFVVWQRQFAVQTDGRGSQDVTSLIGRAVEESGVHTGTAHVFLLHTSASLLLSENADPDVQRDLETWISRVVPDGDPDFLHTAEGADDMAAHVRTMLAGSELTIAVSGAGLTLGTWQGVYLWEHRKRGHRRNIVLTVQGRAQ